MPRPTLANIWPLFVGMGVLMLGAGLQSTLLGVRATIEGFPTAMSPSVFTFSRASLTSCRRRKAEIGRIRLANRPVKITPVQDR